MSKTVIKNEDWERRAPAGTQDKINIIRAEKREKHSTGKK